MIISFVLPSDYIHQNFTLPSFLEFSGRHHNHMTPAGCEKTALLLVLDNQERLVFSSALRSNLRTSIQSDILAAWNSFQKPINVVQIIFGIAMTGQLFHIESAYFQNCFCFLFFFLHQKTSRWNDSGQWKENGSTTLSRERTQNSANHKKVGHAEKDAAWKGCFLA